MEDEITERFLQTVTSKVKVWETRVNTEYFQTVWQAHTSRSCPNLERLKLWFDLQAQYPPLPCLTLCIGSFIFSSFWDGSSTVCSICHCATDGDLDSKG